LHQEDGIKVLLLGREQTVVDLLKRAKQRENQEKEQDDDAKGIGRQSPVQCFYYVDHAITDLQLLQ
jgi:hypothetical protein